MNEQSVTLRPIETHVQLPAQMQQPDSILAIIAAAARDPQVDVGKMSALLEMKERVDAREAKAEYTRAMAAMQPKLPRVKKNGTIDLGKGKPIPFARWEDVDSVIRPILTANGFSLSFPTRTDGGKLHMTCRVSHIGGHSEESECEVMSDAGPGRNQMQAIGSGRSYTKRYLALDMLNIVTEGQDDDGHSAQPLTEDQYQKLATMFDALPTGEVKAGFLKYMNVGTIEAIKGGDYMKAVEALSRKLRQQQVSK